ncbi:MAG TPA: hypothetical protein VGP25_21490 [Gemmatimonadaceae bacterium]|jgi:hypothetical protein|nr:hypothetical protein [Gemmatimonadaceae bacterium]
MADDRQHADVLDAPIAPRKRRRRWPWVLAGIVALPILLFAAWTAITLNYTYADDGQRAGYLQKLSRKGWVCKTWEGELAMVNMPGAAQERFPFTVRSDSIAQLMSKMVGARVSITYEQHKGVPGSCFGDTEYYVKHVQAAAQ